FIGGRVVSRSTSAGSLSAPVALVDVATEKRAMSLVLRELHPWKGLVGSKLMQEYGAHMVRRKCFGPDNDPSEQCLGVEALPVVSLCRLIRHRILSSLVEPSRLQRLSDGAVMDGSRAGLTVTEVLQAVTATFFGGRGRVDDNLRDAQAQWIQVLIESAKAGGEDGLSSVVTATVAELQRIRTIIIAGGEDPHLLGLALIITQFSM
ncbi:hypothetical protein MMPV_009865, partial [Pyropia vietnamensis]